MEREKERAFGLNTNALSIADVVRVLSSAGAKGITEKKVCADVAAGAPTNPDRTINMIHYMAWLTKEIAHGRN
ncbi:hypothetical protein QQ056_07280 [Oscillatoria laete-virens NRMC-F 0139]|nr:hypothetical protein [Oscillatoria laete-virens]MDL5053345.1 hypothetical protein [Oscillatoria laete-virens NRMC-F 0139]